MHSVNASDARLRTESSAFASPDATQSLHRSRARSDVDDAVEAVLPLGELVRLSRQGVDALTAAIATRIGDSIGDAAIVFVRSGSPESVELAAVHHRRQSGTDLLRELLESMHAQPNLQRHLRGGFVETVFRTGEPLLAPESDAAVLRSLFDQHDHEYLHRFGVNGLLAVPLMAAGEPSGVLALTRDRDSAPFAAEDLEVVIGVAHRAAAAIEAATPQAAGGADPQIDDRAAGAMVRSTVDAVILFDDAGTIEMANPASETLLGYPVPQLLGQNIGVLTDTSEGRRDDIVACTDLRTEAGSICETKLRRSDGSLLAAELSVSEVHPSSKARFVAIARDVSHRKRSEEQLLRQANLDPLTGLVNRSSLHRALGSAMRRVDEGGQLALVFIDLDGFKAVNDTFGHTIGDQVLQAAAGRLTNSVRRDDLVVRYGGDEFIIVLEAETNIEEEVARVSARIEQAFEAPFGLDGETRMLGASLGYAIYPEDGTTVSRLIAHADREMYRRKQARKAAAASGDHAR